MIWWLPIAAAAAMYVQDVLSTIMVVAQARGRAHLAASMDVVGWLAQITTTTVSVDALITGSLGSKFTVIAAVSIANYLGTWSGTRLGHRIMPELLRAK